MPKLAELTRKSEARLEITSLWDNLSEEDMEANQSINPDVIRIVPDYVEIGWSIISNVICTPTATQYWETELKSRGLPPPPREEQLAREDIRPESQSIIAVAQVMDIDNFNVKTFKCDVNNTLAMDLKNSISISMGTKCTDIGTIVSTDYWNCEQIVNRYKNIMASSPVRYETVNILSSVVDGKRHGQNPPLGVSQKNRQVVTDYTRLADMLGPVVVFHYNPIPRNPWSPDFVDIIIDIVVSVYGGRVK
ncbi:hypothetical protein [Pseudomonas fluorescens]|uniref:hypothetical protein n=1 Tax=Pseudomonas fluorescens TaxID=294 RepID=UPI0012D2F321|nr:hypothetical protein [Pseudomonas fluorescens]